jgi:hypothetical protein
MDREIEKRTSRRWWRMIAAIVVTSVAGMLIRANLVSAAAPATPVSAVSGQAVPQGDGHDDDHDDDKFEGVIEQLPPDLQDGGWVISGETFVVSTTTVLESEGLTFTVGVTVKVEFRTQDNVKYAKKIEIRDGSHHDGGDDPGNDLKFYGPLVSRPEGKVGPWVVGTTTYTATYTATESTKLEEEHGALVPGICVKVKVNESSPTVAREIESEHEYKCSGRDDGDAKGMLFGVIKQLPEDLQDGDWVIGGQTFVVSTTTELESKHGAFEVGATVKVEFYTDSSTETNYATKIQIKFGNHYGHDHDDDHDDDDDTYGNRPGKEGKSYGPIVSRPDGGTLVGLWNVAGVVYTTTVVTKFYQNDDYQVGEWVRVEYVVNEDGSRRATKIKEIGDHDGATPPGHNRLVGFVDDKPPAFIGTWKIAGALFETTNDTQFREPHGLLAVGSYVVVKYIIANDQRLVYELETHVPPGAGDDNAVGRLESTGDVQVASLASPSEANSTWTVNGVNYVVTEATQLVDLGGELVPGTEVQVNSYTVDGQQYATMVRSVAGKSYLPLMQR